MNITKKISKKNNFIIILASLFLLLFFFSATASAGTCGDGKRDLADGESCDPGQGAPDYCGVFGGTCNSACQCIQKPAPTPTATPTSTPTPTPTANPTPTATPTPSAGCMINCGCANYTQIGYTCDNGCGGTCAGKKDINQRFNCYSSPNNPTFPSYGYYSLDWWNHDYTGHYQPGTKLLKEECEGDDKVSYLCRLDSNNEVYWSFRNLQVLTNQKLCDMNHGQECIVACMNQIAIRFFLPPGALRLTVSRVTVEEDAYVNDVLRYNNLPTKIPSSSLSSGCGTTGVAACDSFTFDKIKQGQEFSGHSYPYGQGSAITKSNAGWLYYRGEEVKYGMGGIDFDMYVNAKIYNDWLAHSGSNADGSINWEKDIESVITYVAPSITSPTPTPIQAPTGPDCAAKTCLGISCWNETAQVEGAKTKDCATITATVNPNILTTPGSIFVKWTSTGASKVEAECFSGPIVIPRGGWFTSDAKCKESGLVKECTDKGYEFKTEKELTGTETCKFYPTNSSDGQQGTPLIFTFEVKKGLTTPTPTPTPTKSAYVTLHTPYVRLEGDKIDGGRGGFFANTRVYKEFFRVFIPPGTTRLMLDINDWLGQSVIARYKKMPTSEFGQLPIAKYGDETLTKLESDDRYFPGYAGTGKVSIAYDGFASPYLLPSNAGWLYVRVDSDKGQQPEKYTNAWSILVNAEAYNDWYDHYGSNADGSINWEKDVEGVITYVAPELTSPTPIPTPTVTPTPSPAAASTCHKNNYCPSETCASKFCSDGCSEGLIRGTRVGC